MAAGPHEPLPDSALVRLLDAELDAAERIDVESHLAGCAGCRERLRALRERTGRLRELLWETDPEVPPAAPPVVARPAGDELARRRERARGQPLTWLRAAAVVAVLLGAGVLASPARAWVADWIAARWAQLSGGSVPAGVTPPAPAAAPQGGSTRVEFTPSGTDFSVDFAAPQTAGGLTVRRGQHPAAVAEIVQGSAELLILPDGIRVANASSSTAEYRLTLPPRVRRVQIRVGDTMLRIVTPLESGVDERVDLSAETR